MRRCIGLAIVTFLNPTSMVRADETIDFDRQIRPILADNCFACHGPDEKKRKADFRLDTKNGAFADLGDHRAIVPRHPDKSELYRRISRTDAGRMPPRRTEKKLSAKQIDLIRRWIQQGAEWQEHWAFAAPKRWPLPNVKSGEWPRDAIDRFVLARLEKEGMAPSGEASKETLLRRVTLDLTGLPPTLEEIDAFLADRSPDAYEKVVDRLLDSPRYGEHFTWSWLDAARYADTNGYQREATRTMWPWRDWVIRALNRDLPYDQFTIEQLAGDLLPNSTLEQKIATGFNRNHMLNGEGGRIAEESRVEYVVDRVETTSTVWLGLTVGCCRCHDHKFDPITQREHFQLFAYFNSVDETGGVDRGGNAKPVIPLPTREQRRKQEELRAQIARLEKQKDDDAKKKLVQIKKQLQALEKSFVETMVMRDRDTPRETYRLIRGQWDKPDKSAKLSPGVPAVLTPLPKDAPANRLALAQWLVNAGNPLTARVAVNRAWLHFFGTGIVKTAEDFGTQGERPSHPKLLDWLALEHVRQGWSTKELHRRIVTSATYRQSSRVTPKLLERDPNNRLLARGPRYRLSSQALRDQALALSGLLVDRQGGPSVKPYHPLGVWADLTLGKIKYVQDHGEKLYRRSVYTFWRRSVGPANLFDTSARQVCKVRQSRTNTPLHALTLMNDVTYVEAARVLAEKVMKLEEAPMKRLTLMFRMMTARRPSAK